MKSYILIWHIDDFAEEGGGLDYCFLDSLEKTEAKVNELMRNPKCEIRYAGGIAKDLHLTPIEKVIKWKVE